MRPDSTPELTKGRVELERITPVRMKPDDSSSVLTLHRVEELTAGPSNSLQMRSQFA